MIIAADGPHIADHGRWTLGALVGWPITVASTLALLALFGWCAAKSRKASSTKKSSYDLVSPKTMWQNFSLIPLVVVLVVVTAVGFGSWPWQSQYHQYRHVTGVVESIANPITQAGTGDTVIQLVGSSRQFDVMDTRGSLLKVGDSVSLFCIRAYAYGSNNAGYECSWGRS